MEDLRQLVQQLVSHAPYKPLKLPSKFEKWVDYLSTRLLLASGLLFLLLVLLLIVFIVFSIQVEPNSWLSFSIMLLGVLTQFLALAALTVQPLLVLPEIRYFYRRSLADFVDQVAHDEKIVAILCGFDKNTLVAAQYWLQVKINRIHRLVSSVLGEKTAALAIAGFSATLMKDLGVFREGGFFFIGMAFSQYRHLSTMVWLFC